MAGCDEMRAEHIAYRITALLSQERSLIMEFALFSYGYMYFQALRLVEAMAVRPILVRSSLEQKRSCLFFLRCRI